MKASPNGWTVDTYAAHNEALRAAEEKFQAERDRRYSDVAGERDRALQIEKEANKTALQLARDIQTYKDMKANELREQIASERGLYATKADLAALSDKVTVTLAPVLGFVAKEQGRDTGVMDNRASIAWVVAIIASLIAIGTFVFRDAPAAVQPAPQIIYVPAAPRTLLPQQSQQGPP